MKQVLLYLLSAIVVGCSAQNVEVSAAVRAEQKASAEMEALRAAKYKRIAELKAKDQKEAFERGITTDSLIKEKSVVYLTKGTFNDNLNVAKAEKGKWAYGNCSSFVQPLGAVYSLDQRTMVIDTPGYYYFSQDVKWNPNHCLNTTAIVITADNVVLDLKGFTLSATNADTTRPFTGISILGATNVTVKNGAVSGLTHYGIAAELSKNVTIDNITISNLKCYNVNKADMFVTPCGIIFSGVNTFAVKNSKVVNVHTTSSSCAGIQVVLSKNGTVVNDTISNLKNYDGSVQGFSYIESDSITTKYCYATAFQSFFQGVTSTLGHTVIGFIPSYCKYLNYDYCSASHMTGCCDDCHGMSVFLDSAVTINNFVASHIVDGISPYNTGAKATGLEVYGYDVNVNNSNVDSIIAIVPQDLQSTGFSAWGSNIVFNHCIAQNVQVLNAQLTPDTSKGRGTGFGWAPDPRAEFDTVTANAITYINCVAVNCQLGFDTWNHTNATWENDIAINCQLPLLFAPQSKRTLTMNKCSESPDGKPFRVVLINKTDRTTPPYIHSSNK